MRILISTFILLWSFSVQADDYEAKVDEVLTLTGQKAALAPVMNTMITQLRPLMVNSIKGQVEQGGKTVDEARLNKLLDKWQEIFMRDFDGQLMGMVAKEYKKHLSEGDLTALIEVLKQPAYQKFASKTVELTMGLQQAGAKIGSTLGQAALMEAMQEIPMESLAK